MRFPGSLPPLLSGPPLSIVLFSLSSSILIPISSFLFSETLCPGRDSSRSVLEGVHRPRLLRHPQSLWQTPALTVYWIGQNLPTYCLVNSYCYFGHLLFSGLSKSVKLHCFSLLFLFRCWYDSGLPRKAVGGLSSLTCILKFVWMPCNLVSE